MTVSPGTPTFTPPAYSVPMLAAGSVAVGAAITNVILESIAGAAQNNKAFTFGQPFKQGELAPDFCVVGRIAGESDIPLQVNVKATHPDGSVRHAILSGILPVIGAGATKRMALVRVATSSVSSTATPSTGFTGFAAKVLLDFGGRVYTADAAPALAAGINASKAWLAGGIVTEYSAMVTPVDSAAAAHPDLQVQFNVRYYPAANAYRVGIAIEHTKAYTANNDLSYTGSIQVGGATVYTMPNPLVQFPRSRWRKLYWINDTSPLVVRHNSAYLIGTKQVANYDQRITVTESALNSYVTQMADSTKFKPMGTGIFTPDMGATGGRPDIGLLPGYGAATVLSMDKRAIAMNVASGELGGTWASHLRDTSTGPGAGMPLSVINWPYITDLGNPGDANNPNTGQNEKLPARNSVTTGVLVTEESHQPNFAYLPYLLTGDYFFLEELQFWVTFNLAVYNPGYRQREKGLIYATQLRGQGWSMRTLGEAAAIVPDSHPLKSHFTYWIDTNLDWYNARFTDNAGANQIGVNDLDRPHHGGLCIPQWMDDHFTSSIGHVWELGYPKAKRLLTWKAKYQIGRMLAPGVCWNHAAMYDLQVSDVAWDPVYTTLAEAYSKTAASGFDPYLTPEVHALPCGSSERLVQLNLTRPQPSNPFTAKEMTGYSAGTEGYVANYQPALALAVDSGYTNGDLAWMLYDSRDNQQDYGNSPQFAIVPRTGAPQTMTAPPDIYTVSSGQPIYGGRAAPTTAGPIFSSLAIDDSSTDANPSDPYYAANVKGRPLVMNLHGSGGAIGNGRHYTATVTGSRVIHGNDQFVFGLVAAYRAVSGGYVWHGEVRPQDFYGLWPSGKNRESQHMGFVDADGLVNLVTEHRYDDVIAWFKDPTNVATKGYDLLARALTGGSMGGWAVISLGMHRYGEFAALYADRPRFRYGYYANTVSVSTWEGGWTDYPTSSAPQIQPADGGGSVAKYRDMIAYILDLANKIRPLFWCLGRQDGFATFQDSIDAVDALRATGRMFAFVWNNGDHSTGSQMETLFQSYPYGTHRLDQGWVVFSEHSRDKDPRVDLVGGINIGLSQRITSETSTSFTCEVTNILGACTVKVAPCSDIYTGNKTAKLVTIPAAGAYVAVQFP